MASVTANTTGVPIERELKLAVPQTFRLPPLAMVAPVRTSGPSRLRTTFWDTTDLALAAWGCMLRFRSGEGWTVKLPDLGGARGLERPELTFSGDPAGPPAEALDVLAAFLRGRPVLPVAHLVTLRRRIALGGGDDALVEIVDDRIATDEPAARAGRQIEVELRSPGATALRDEVVRRLVRAGAVVGAQRTKYEWVLEGRLPPPEVDPPIATPRATARDAVRRAIGGSVVSLVRCDAQIRGGRDPEAIHGARVAVHRLRSDLRAFAAILDPEWTRSLRDELRWLGDALGGVRDREVLSSRIASQGQRLDDADVAPLIGLLEAEIRDGRATLGAVLRDDRYTALLQRIVEASNDPKLAVADGLATELLRPAVGVAWRRLRRAVRRARARGSDRELHRARIAAKRLRYTCEALAPVFGKRAARLARAANRLQDVLGEHQDAVIAREWLRAHADANGAITAFAVGELAALELVARDETREQWIAIWKSTRRWRPSKWK